MDRIGAPIPVELTPQIVALGRWAVEEHNKKENTRLIFTRVLSASDEYVVEGVKSYLLLQAADADGWRINTYHAQVFVKAGWSVNELLLFVRISRAS